MYIRNMATILQSALSVYMRFLIFENIILARAQFFNKTLHCKMSDVSFVIGNTVYCTQDEPHRKGRNCSKVPAEVALQIVEQH